MASDPEPPTVGQPAPLFSLTSVQGGVIEKKKAAMGPGCPLLLEPAAAPTA